MNIYYLFYCRAYDWYNTNQKKSKDTLRGSAIVLLSVMPLIHILTLIGIAGIINNHTPLNAWLIVFTYAGLLVLNWLVISPEKSDSLRVEYLSMDDKRKAKINGWFYCYLIITTLLLISVLSYTAYYKHKYGNYDL